ERLLDQSEPIVDLRAKGTRRDRDRALRFLDAIEDRQSRRGMNSRSREARLKEHGPSVVGVELPRLRHKMHCLTALRGECRGKFEVIERGLFVGGALCILLNERFCRVVPGAHMRVASVSIEIDGLGSIARCRREERAKV